MGLKIAACDDVDALIVPHREAMKVAYAGFFDTAFPTDDVLREEWRTLLARPATLVLLASVDGQPAGTVAVQVADGVGWLERLYVHPAQQGRGIGRALARRGLAQLRARGCRQANLWVLEVNRAAISIYESWGWRRVPSEPYAPFGLPQARYAIDL